MNILLLFLSVFCVSTPTSYSQNVTNNLHLGLTERIGNFSIELMYYTTTEAQRGGTNMIISPITVWNVLAVISEGAASETLNQICKALRIVPNQRKSNREHFQDLSKYLQVNTSTVELQKFNALFIQEDKSPQKDFLELAKAYGTRMISVNFSNPDVTANKINTAVSNITHNKIPSLVNANDLSDVNLLLTSVLYFKGQWTVPFNSSYTEKVPFHNSKGTVVGYVNMMYNRYTYPYANIRSLQARIVEIPYGSQNRLSMLIMLPNPNVTILQMLENFLTVPLDKIFKELKLSKDEYSDDEVDLFLPRFKVESKLTLTDHLRSMGIYDLFDVNAARLPHIASHPVFVSKVVHKAEIVVTEEGTEAAAATAAEFSNRISTIRYEANRPFLYFIIEKTTNSITFGGIYEQPSLY